MSDPDKHKASVAVAGPVKPKRKLYEACPICNDQPPPASCPCEVLFVLDTGLTVEQAEYMAKLDLLRQEAGISAAMLRDGRAAAFRDLLAACKAMLARLNNPLLDASLFQDVREQVALAVAKAEGSSS